MRMHGFMHAAKVLPPKCVHLWVKCPLCKHIGCRQCGQKKLADFVDKKKGGKR